MSEHLHLLPDYRPGDRPHLLAAECWCRPILKWRHEVETHTGMPHRVLVHRDDGVKP